MSVFAQVNLVVADMAAAVEFYRLLELDVPDPFEWPPGSGAEHVEIHTGGGGHLALDNHPQARIYNRHFEPGGDAGSAIVGLSVDTRDDVDRLYQRAADAGHPLGQEPHDAFWGSRYAIVLDPDGHRVGLKSPIDDTQAYQPDVDQPGRRESVDVAQSRPTPDRRGWVQSPASARALPAAGGHLLAGGDDTAGRFCMIHTRVPPGDATPLHRHGSMDESLYVLAGVLAVTCGDDLLDVAAGGFVHLPRGIPHRYVAGPDGAEFLIHGVPAGLEDFFEDWGSGMDPGTAGRRHDIEFLS